MLRYTIIIGAVVILSAGPILAQAKADKAPARKAADQAGKKDSGEAEKLTVTATSVSGIAEQRSATDEKAKWAPIKAGDVLNEMTLVRTGLGGKVVLKFSNRGNVTIKSGSKIGIASFRKQGKLVKTRLGLKYGAIRAQVDSSRGANDFRVRTAVGTLAATGTGGYMAQWGDFGFRAWGTDGSWEQRIADRIITLLAGEWTDGELTMPLAALLAKHGVKLGDLYGGLTLAELKNLLLNDGGRGIIGFVGNARAGGAPRLQLRTTTANNQNPPLEGPVGGIPAPVGGGDSDRYGDDPENRHRR